MDIKAELENKVKRYRELTAEAIEKVKLNKNLCKERKKIAEDFLDMAKRYFADGKFFEKKGKLATALAAYSYAHAWLDAGARAELFDVKNNRLFAKD
ncbi:MAG: DUF357 domain-containing protein [Candidatus Diapherotrites archaeon]|nr:DUF357 domain-containing protein [Candidatus Diapherotrites archaeon]